MRLISLLLAAPCGLAFQQRPPSKGPGELSELLADAAKTLKKVPLPRIDVEGLVREGQRKSSAERLRRAASSRMKAPEQLDEAQVAKMTALGYVYDEEKRTWAQKKRGSARGEEEVPIRTVSEDVDPYTEEMWFSAAAAEFDDEMVVVKPFNRRRAKFSPPPRKEAEEDVEAAVSLATQEPLQRLGFAYDAETGRWSRGAARRTPLTVAIASGKRTLKVSAVEEWDHAAINRLDYLLSQSLMDAPENVWNGVLRWARDPVFPFVWLALQAKLWDVWSAAEPVLGDAFDETRQTLGFDVAALGDGEKVALGACAATFALASWLAKAAWAGSSGSLAVGATERAIADAACTNFEAAPLSAAKRAELGVPHALIAATLTALSAAPRAAFLHAYVQRKVEYDFFSAAPLDGVIGDFGAAALASASVGAVLAVGALSGMGEAATWNWARPPATAADELNAIANELETDALRVRKLEERAESLDPNRDGPAVVKVAKQSAANALRDADAFERVADAWLHEFHGTSSLEVEIDDAARGKKADPAVGAAVLSGAAAAAAYAATGNDLHAPIAVHAAGALVDAFAPTDVSKEKVAELTIDAAPSD